MTHYGYSHPGTWGHECGAPVVLTQAVTSELTTNGVYWLRRCAKCIQWTVPDNQGTKRDAWVSFDPTVHVNKWK